MAPPAGVEGRLPHLPAAEKRRRPFQRPSQPLTPCATPYYYSPLMSKALPEHIYPLRLARRGESLAGSVVFSRMPRIAEMLCEGANRADFTLRFGYDGGGQACVLGHIDAKLVVLCQRCLEPMEIGVARQVRLALVGEHDDPAGLDDLAGLDATYDPLPVGDGPVSLSGIVEDELILAMPDFSRHPRSECRMPPGADAVDVIDDEASGNDVDTAGESGEENPFSILESLKPRTAP